MRQDDRRFSSVSHGLKKGFFFKIIQGFYFLKKQN